MFRELHRLGSKPFHAVHNRQFVDQYGSGIDVMAEDWDTLVILDACRLDYFRSQNTIGGELQSAVSRGANSWEFMEGNFVGREFHDTVYVTANPHARKLDADTFHAIETVLHRWDDDIGTVRPEAVVAAALEANERYPKKRLIIHFMQPHRPYLGEMADGLRERIDLRGYKRDRGLENQHYERTGIHMWRAVKTGQVSHEEMKRAYSETLDITFEEVKALLDALDGKAIITADHGEMLGERVYPFTVRQYGHPHGLHAEELRLVPWHVVPGARRREIERDAPVETDRLAEETIDDRLQALGYKS